GELFGLPMVNLIPEKLALQKQDGRYLLVQGSEVVLPLGDRPEDARQLLDWLQRHRVDRLARLMTPDGHGMTFFLKRGNRSCQPRVGGSPGRGEGRRRTESDWLDCTSTDRLLDWQPTRLNGRRWRLLACGICRQLDRFEGDEPLQKALDAAEAFADGGLSAK